MADLVGEKNNYKLSFQYIWILILFIYYFLFF